MIGTKVKGFRHLIRMAKTLSEVQFFFKYNIFSIGSGVALYVNYDEHKNPYMSAKSDYIMIFNDAVSNVNYNPMSHNGDGICKRIRELKEKYPYAWVIPVTKRNFTEDYHILNEFLAVPSDFDKKYSEFCEANKKQMANATRFADSNGSVLKYFFAITNGSKNFFFWGVNLYFKQGINFFLLEKIMIWYDGYNQLSNKLNKGTITGYTNNHDIFTLLREITKLRRDKRANDVINMFNTAQKKALKGYSLNARDYDTLSKFGKLSNKKKNNFIRKVSTIDDPVEILKQMSFLADIHFEWKKESLLDFVKNSEGFNCEIVMDKGDMVLLKVKDYETVKRLAKTTNWCISKDKKYWNEYVEHNPNATQYVLMDFSRKEDDNLSIVGFTSVHDRGITNAHDFQNRNLMQGRRVNTISEIKSFVSKYVDCSSIYGVLDKYGIKMSDVVTYEPNQYKWDRESMFEYLNKCVDADDYYIIADDGKKVALIVENDDVRYFLGDAYIDRREHRYDGSQHIIFADFTKDATDPEKLVFGIINHNFEQHESTCARLFNDKFEAINQSFDSKLEEYGLPYDIICRKDNIVERFYASLSSLELATAKDLIKNDKVKNSLNEQDRCDFVREQIVNVTFGYNSADYINLFYDNGYKLSDVIGTRYASDLARRIISIMLETAHALFIGGRAQVPDANSIKNFYDEKINDYNSALYIGDFTMLMKMMDNEGRRDFYYRLVTFIHDRHVVCDLCDLILTRVINSTDFGNDYDLAKFIISYAYNFGSPRVVNAINTKDDINDNIREFINSCKKFTVKTTEMWVRNDDGIYVIDGVNEEAVAHAPRRR